MFSSVIGKLKEAGRWIGNNPIKSAAIGAAIALTGGAAAYMMSSAGVAAAAAPAVSTVSAVSELGNGITSLRPIYQKMSSGGGVLNNFAPLVGL